MMLTNRLHKKQEKENSVGLQGQQPIANQHFLSRKLSIKQINDFGSFNQGMGAPRTQRARKPSVNQGAIEASEGQDFKI